LFIVQNGNFRAVVYCPIRQKIIFRNLLYHPVNLSFFF
jgi:hypothetical protein